MRKSGGMRFEICAKFIFRINVPSPVSQLTPSAAET